MSTQAATASPATEAGAPVAAPNRALLGLLLALAGAALFATKGIVIKLALREGIDTVTTLTWRMIVAVPIFIVVGSFAYRRQKRAQGAESPPLLTPGRLAAIAGVGILGYYVSSTLDFMSLKYISAQFNRLILLTYPFFVVAFGAIFFGRRVTLNMVVALAVSYFGIAIIFWRDFAIEGHDVLLGAGLVFLCAITYAGYQILAKPLIDTVGAQLFTSLAMSAAGPVVVAQFLVTHPIGDLAISGNGFMLMLAIGTLSTVLPAYCISGAIGMIGPERTAIIGNVSPVVTVMLAIFVLGEAFTPWHAAGTALVLGGVWLFTRKPRKAKAAVAAAAGA